MFVYISVYAHIHVCICIGVHIDIQIHILIVLVSAQVWNFCEYFAGAAEVTRALRASGRPGVCLDIDLEGKAMDILTVSGMATPSCSKHCSVVCYIAIYTYYIHF